MKRRVGFTDLSRLLVRCCHRPGQCHLPDKEFRYLRTVLNVTNQHACAWFAKTTRLRTRLLPAYRYAARTVSSTRTSSGAWRAVSEDSLTSNNSMIESSEYLRLIAPPSFMSRRIARISSMPSLDTWRPS